MTTKMLPIACNTCIKSWSKLKKSETISKNVPFTYRYNCEVIKYPKIKKNNPVIAFNVSYAKEGKLYPVCVSKNSSRLEKWIILLMTQNKKNGIILQ